MSLRTLFVLLALVLQPQPLSAQYIGIFLDSDASSCVATVGPAPYIDLHVIAILEGDVTEMAGAQFQITGAPAGWTPYTVLWVPDPGLTISLGHPVFPTPTHPNTPGVNVTFSKCKTRAQDGLIPLGRVILLGAPTPEDVHLRVEFFKLVPPDLPCPFVNSCTGPAFAPTCVGGGEVVLNGPGSSSCRVAVEGSTWTSVKKLFSTTP